MDQNARNHFVLYAMRRFNKKRSTAGPNSARSNTFQYYLKNEDGVEVRVCRTFFIAVLGYPPENNRNLKTVRSKAKLPSSVAVEYDQRGRHPNKNKIDESTVVDHILSFNATSSHYRREHAPNRLYLPSDISIMKMYSHFREIHKDFKISYEVHRQHVKKLNISFAKLGCEECFTCEKFKLHELEKSHDVTTCEECSSYGIHHEKYTAAREEYQADGVVAETARDQLFVSADLQKVIKLPRADMFKEVLFTPRIIAFNETFAPIGKNMLKKKPTAVIWHEGVAGRKKEDIISTFHAFLLKKNNIEKITIWLDNCSAQNKNWAFLSFCVYIVNSPEVKLNNLILKFFEPGHTFMSADHFHHQVENSLKKGNKVYDFIDFQSCVQDANSGNVDVCTMYKESFFDWKDCTSKSKIQNNRTRVYLHDMVLISFERCSYKLKYKTSFKGDTMDLDFLMAKFCKNGVPKPQCRNSDRGITKERKEMLLSKLRSIIPSNCLPFWENLPVSEIGDDI